MTDLQDALDKARDYNDEEKPKSALKLLKPLYEADRNNKEVVLEIVTAFELMKEWEKARDALKMLVRRDPRDVESWLRLSYTFTEEENRPMALKTVNTALGQAGDDLHLIARKADLTADVEGLEAMVRFTDRMLAAYPAHRREILVRRADIFESAAMEPGEGEAVVKDMLGIAYGRESLERALEDLTAAAEIDPAESGVRFKRAGIFKRLERYDEAVADYDRLLETLGEEQEVFRPYLEEQRAGCLNGGKNERAHCAAAIKEGVIDVEKRGTLSQEEHMANSIAEVMAEQCENGDLLGLLEEMNDDPDEMIALTLARTILQNGRIPYADYQETDAGEYEKAAQRFCDKAEKVFKKHAFTSLGDYEPRGLAQQLGKRLFFRLFRSEDGCTNGSAYYIRPLWPGLLSWIVMRLSGQWKIARVVELESETEDGRFIVTNNTGGINGFSHGSHVAIEALPLNAAHAEVFSVHNARLEALRAQGSTLVSFEGVEEIFAMQERLRVRNNAYREQIGFVTDEELRTFLGNQYDRFAPKIRKYVQKLAGA